MKIEKYVRSSPLCGLYAAYHRLFASLQARLLEKEGVHFLQALILTAIFFEERPARPGELSAALGIPASNLSHALRSLERKGCVVRATLKNDARAYIFSLSPTGRRKAVRLIKLFDILQETAEAKMGGDWAHRLGEFAELGEELADKI